MHRRSNSLSSLKVSKSSLSPVSHEQTPYLPDDSPSPPSLDEDLQTPVSRVKAPRLSPPAQPVPQGFGGFSLKSAGPGAVTEKAFQDFNMQDYFPSSPVRQHRTRISSTSRQNVDISKIEGGADILSNVWSAVKNITREGSFKSEAVTEVELDGMSPEEVAAAVPVPSQKEQRKLTRSLSLGNDPALGPVSSIKSPAVRIKGGRAPLLEQPAATAQDEDEQSDHSPREELTQSRRGSEEYVTCDEDEAQDVGHLSDNATISMSDVNIEFKESGVDPEPKDSSVESMRTASSKDASPLPLQADTSRTAGAQAKFLDEEVDAMESYEMARYKKIQQELERSRREGTDPTLVGSWSRTPPSPKRPRLSEHERTASDNGDEVIEKSDISRATCTVGEGEKSSQGGKDIAEHGKTMQVSRVGREVQEDDMGDEYEEHEFDVDDRLDGLNFRTGLEKALLEEMRALTPSPYGSRVTSVGSTSELGRKTPPVDLTNTSESMPPECYESAPASTEAEGLAGVLSNISGVQDSGDQLGQESFDDNDYVKDCLSDSSREDALSLTDVGEGTAGAEGQPRLSLESGVSGSEEMQEPSFDVDEAGIIGEDGAEGELNASDELPCRRLSMESGLSDDDEGDLDSYLSSSAKKSATRSAHDLSCTSQDTQEVRARDIGAGAIQSDLAAPVNTASEALVREDHVATGSLEERLARLLEKKEKGTANKCLDDNDVVPSALSSESGGNASGHGILTGSLDSRPSRGFGDVQKSTKESMSTSHVAEIESMQDRMQKAVDEAKSAVEMAPVSGAFSRDSIENRLAALQQQQSLPMSCKGEMGPVDPTDDSGQHDSPEQSGTNVRREELHQRFLKEQEELAEQVARVERMRASMDAENRLRHQRWKSKAQQSQACDEEFQSQQEKIRKDFEARMKAEDERMMKAKEESDRVLREKRKEVEEILEREIAAVQGVDVEKARVLTCMRSEFDAKMIEIDEERERRDADLTEKYKCQFEEERKQNVKEFASRLGVDEDTAKKVLAEVTVTGNHTSVGDAAPIAMLGVAPVYSRGLAGASSSPIPSDQTTNLKVDHDEGQGSNNITDSSENSLHEGSSPNQIATKSDASLLPAEASVSSPLSNGIHRSTSQPPKAPKTLCLDFEESSPVQVSADDDVTGGRVSDIDFEDSGELGLRDHIIRAEEIEYAAKAAMAAYNEDQSHVGYDHEERDIRSPDISVDICQGDDVSEAHGSGLNESADDASVDHGDSDAQEILRQKLLENIQEKHNLRSAVQFLIDENALLKSKYSEIETSAREMEECQKEWRVAKAKYEQDIADLHHKQQKQRVEHEKVLMARDARIAELTEKLGGLKSRMDAEVSPSEREGESTLMNEVNDLRRENDVLRIRNADLQEIAEMRADPAEYGDALVAARDELKNMMTSHMTQVASLKVDMDKVVHGAEKTRQENESLKKTIVELENQITSINRTAVATMNRDGELVQEIARLNERLSSLQSELSHEKPSGKAGGVKENKAMPGTPPRPPHSPLGHYDAKISTKPPKVMDDMFIAKHTLPGGGVPSYNSDDTEAGMERVRRILVDKKLASSYHW